MGAGEEVALGSVDARPLGSLPCVPCSSSSAWRAAEASLAEGGAVLRLRLAGGGAPVEVRGGRLRPGPPGVLDVVGSWRIRVPSGPEGVLKLLAALREGGLFTRRAADFVRRDALVLGKGASGLVYSGTCRVSGRRVAVKYPRLKRKHAAKAVLHECDVLRKLRADKQGLHPAVPRLYDWLEGPKGEIVVVTELLDGGELFERVAARGRLTEEDTRRIVFSVCQGVDYMHQNGVCHRDLKPENIVLANALRGEPERVVICDYDLSKVFDHPVDGWSGKTDTPCGTRNYKPPEVGLMSTQRWSYNAASADVWSMGCMAYVLLTGRLPFPHRNEPSPFELPPKLVPEFPPKIFLHTSGAAVNFLKATIEPDPNKRTTIQQCLRHPWFRGLQRDDAVRAVRRGDGAAVGDGLADQGAPPPPSTKKLEVSVQDTSEEPTDASSGLPLESPSLLRQPGTKEKVRDIMASVLRASREDDKLDDEVVALGTVNEIELVQPPPPTLSKLRIRGDDAADGNPTEWSPFTRLIGVIRTPTSVRTPSSDA